MRDEMEELLKGELRTLAIRTRDRLNYKQKQMAEALAMSNSSYSDIETGEHMCGTLTVILLLMLQPDPDECLRDLETKFQKLYDRVEQLI